jgi:hypothetical protein
MVQDADDCCNIPISLINLGTGVMSVNASLEKSRNSLKTGGWRARPLFMPRCDRIPVMLTC